MQEDYRKVLDGYRDEKDSLNARIKATLTEIVGKAPSKTISLTGWPASALCEGTEAWFEVPVFGVRLNGGRLEITVEHRGSGDSEVPDWNKDSVFDGGSHYADIDWLSVLDSVTTALGM